MMNNNKISAVVVTYNRLPLLQNCIEHLHTQTVPCDILVVDNASTDGTAQWLEAQQAAELFHDTEINRALQRLDRATDLSLIPDLGRFCKWRYEKDRRARNGGKKRASVWACEPLVSLAVTAWRGWYSVRENGVRFFCID